MENNPRKHGSCRQYPWNPFSIIVLIVFSILSPLFNPWKLLLRMSNYWGQISMGLYCNMEYDSLRWPVAWVSPSWSLLESELGNCYLSAMGWFDGLSMDLSDNDKLRSPFRVRWWGGRCLSLKGASGFGCTVLRSWWISMSWRWPHLRILHDRALVLGKRNIYGIILRCLRSKTYHSIIVVCRRISGEKLMAINPTNEIVWTGW